MVGVVAVPALIFLALLFRIPRSPRWSASRYQVDEALEVLGQMGAPDPDAELAEIQAALNSEHAVEHEPVFRWKYRFPLFLAITIGAFNQLEGINAILYYIKGIFAAAGLHPAFRRPRRWPSGPRNLIFTLVGMSVIDHFGRKSLLGCRGRGGHRALPLRRRLGLYHQQPSGRPAGPAGGLYRLLRALAGRGHLGLPGRGLSHIGAKGRAWAAPATGFWLPSSRTFFPLVGAPGMAPECLSSSSLPPQRCNSWWSLSSIRKPRGKRWSSCSAGW